MLMLLPSRAWSDKNLICYRELMIWHHHEEGLSPWKLLSSDPLHSSTSPTLFLSKWISRTFHKKNYETFQPQPELFNVLNVENWVVQSVSRLDFTCRKAFLTEIESFWLFFDKLGLVMLSLEINSKKQNQHAEKSRNLE